ncbi:malto-oligosyltrehalose trehalohydrolase [Kineobactrum sediminis]|uniref:Malto-oligosyltrehalose trehalohydrolase n=1 Tax=Kineobactrum sediminis TaxID=1905677 RepID=A0A2N5Y2G5_9GAMM|nr:malto-oligosyltrehalose trehalohydrolase [Kineobactrum sediminis]PLW82582.1 malto-oligosyltrehalose trehalohydrolase [Kineobactrum sediminis]
MPFGAHVVDEARVRFRLWAPAASEVAVCLQVDTGERVLAMTPEGDGWFALLTTEAGPGSRYWYLIDNDLRIPDPASRFQPEDVEGPSQVVNPLSWEWLDSSWRGRAWEEVVLYELHIGTFTPAGNFAGVCERLDYLVGLGISAIEIMPVADFPGDRNWGYDGVLPFAPDSSYGDPDEFKALIQAAHERGLMVFLDVVYNHFGPLGNYLHQYAPQFFSSRHHTPWGAAINFDDEHSDTVRRFFIHNALYWIEEFNLDGLRLDAVHAIVDDSYPDILEELAAAVNNGPGQERHVHLVLENDNNIARYMQRDNDESARQYVAQWNDDIHHALHILLTGETDGYYSDYEQLPGWYLGRCLAHGFGYQGEMSGFRGARRGEPSTELPAASFVSFLQNHDQVGNRALGERINALTGDRQVQVAAAILLLAPAPPLLFMGQEFGATQPFQYFCSFTGDMAEAVTRGRREEFSHFAQFSDPTARDRIPDPNAVDTFRNSKLDWADLLEPDHAQWLAFYQELLRLRQTEIIPRATGVGAGEFLLLGANAVWVQWQLAEGSVLTLIANIGDSPVSVSDDTGARARVLYAQPPALAAELAAHRLPPWSLRWTLQEAGK